jgi:hypothetical protein
VGTCFISHAELVGCDGGKERDWGGRYAVRDIIFCRNKMRRRPHREIDGIIV